MPNLFSSCLSTLLAKSESSDFSWRGSAVLVSNLGALSRIRTFSIVGFPSSILFAAAIVFFEDMVTSCLRYSRGRVVLRFVISVEELWSTASL